MPIGLPVTVACTLLVTAALTAYTGYRHSPAPHPADPPSGGVTHIQIDSRPLHRNVKRFGINLSGQAFYDSGQMLRNLIARNPGFEGETWQSILRCKVVTANTCTDENQYAAWPAGFMAGGRYTVISGAAQATTGSVTSSSAVSAGQGVTVTLQPAPRGLAKGDFVVVRADKPGDAGAGWWITLDGGATTATEAQDLSPHTPGRQALRVEAAAPGQTARVVSYFDTFEGRSFLQLRGAYTIRFRAKALAGKRTLDLKLERLDTRHGGHTFVSRQIALAPTWQDYSFAFRAAEDGSAIGSVALSFTLAGSSALLDDVALDEGEPSAANPTEFRSAVVDTLRELHSGILRFMDNGTNFGSSIDNMLATSFARQRTGASTQTTRQEDIPLGLGDLLALAKAVGAEPWYSMPPGISPEEAKHLIEYLAGAPDTPYGKIRAAAGQVAPWTSVFPVIHLELGNEQWNSRSFAGSTIADPTVYGQRAAEIFSAARSVRGFQASSFDLILGSWATVPWWTSKELESSRAFDSVAVAPYLFTDFNDARSTESVFGPMFAQPEMLDSRPDGYMAQQRKAGGSARLAVYETNLGTMTGTVTQAQIDQAIPSLGAGIAVADHMLLMLRDLGVIDQCLFALPEYQNDLASGDPKRKIPLWGAVVDMGGATNLRRPSFLAEQMVNEAILPTMLGTRITGANPTWDQSESANDKIALKGARQLQSFAFADGARRSLILINLSRTESLPVVLDGPNGPSGSVEQKRVTSARITDSNENTAAVVPSRQALPHFNPTETYWLPPFSITTLTWHAP